MWPDVDGLPVPRAHRSSTDDRIGSGAIGGTVAMDAAGNVVFTLGLNFKWPASFRSPTSAVMPTITFGPPTKQYSTDEAVRVVASNAACSGITKRLPMGQSAPRQSFAFSFSGSNLFHRPSGTRAERGQRPTVNNGAATHDKGNGKS